MIKRVSELRQLGNVDSTGIPGRDYTTVDIQLLCSLGATAGYLSVLVTALYISSVDVQKLYAKPQLLWFILPVQLYWISRIWLLANRDWIDQDPILFALKDRPTYVAVAFALAIAAFAV